MASLVVREFTSLLYASIVEHYSSEMLFSLPYSNANVIRRLMKYLHPDLFLIGVFAVRKYN